MVAALILPVFIVVGGGLMLGLGVVVTKIRGNPNPGTQPQSDETKAVIVATPRSFHNIMFRSQNLLYPETVSVCTAEEWSKIVELCQPLGEKNVGGNVYVFGFDLSASEPPSVVKEVEAALKGALPNLQITVTANSYYDMGLTNRRGFFEFVVTVEKKRSGFFGA